MEGCQKGRSPSQLTTHNTALHSSHSITCTNTWHLSRPTTVPSYNYNSIRWTVLAQTINVTDGRTRRWQRRRFIALRIKKDKFSALGIWMWSWVKACSLRSSNNNTVQSWAHCNWRFGSIIIAKLQIYWVLRSPNNCHQNDQIASKCIKSHIEFQKFSGGDK